MMRRTERAASRVGLRLLAALPLVFMLLAGPCLAPARGVGAAGRALPAVGDTPRATSAPRATATVSTTGYSTTPVAGPSATPSVTVTAQGRVTATAPTPAPTPVPRPLVSLSAGPATTGVLSVLVTAAGGTTSQGLHLLVPTGAFTTGVSLSVALPALSNLPEPVGRLGEDNNAAIGWAYDVNAVNPRTSQPIRHFRPGHPLVLQLTYDPAQAVGIDPATLRVCFFDVSSGDWRPLPTTIDSVLHVLTATTDHLTLFGVRVTARTQAQLTRAQVRLASLAAAGPPRVAALPLAHQAVDGFPVVVTLSSAPQHAPVTVIVTGPPHGELQASFTMAGTTLVQTLPLDARGYAATTFVPASPVHGPGQLEVAVTVTRGAMQTTQTRVVLLLPGRAAGTPAVGAPLLLATLSRATVRAGAPGPLLSVVTTPGAQVSAALWQGQAPVAGLAPATGKAGAAGSVRLQLPAVPPSLAATAPAALHLRVLVTATLHGAITQVSLPLTMIS